MGRQAVAGGTTANGDRIKVFFAAMARFYGTTCHLCGGPGANTIDHLIPTSVRPDLRWEMSNVRPAHHRCNSLRKDAPLTRAYAAEGW